MLNPIVTTDPLQLDAKEIFSHLPAGRVGEADRRYMDEVLAAGFGNFESAGILERFESAFAEKFGVGYGISMNSGSGTLLSCLLAAGVGPGDEVICPVYGMPAAAFATVHAGAVPVLADCDPDTYNIDPKDVERRITPLTRAIVVICHFGLPVEFDAIMQLAEQHDLTVIEDDAQCFLSLYKDKPVGTIGHAASFSFQGSKHMTSGSDGGMVITDDEAFGTSVRKAAVHGYRTLTAKPGSTMIPRDERQDWSYQRYDSLGYNFRMSAPQAALGLGQLERLDYLVAARRYIAARYEEVIRGEKCEWLSTPVVPPGMTHSCYIYASKLDEKMLGVQWRDWRKTFIEKGGDGLYGSCLPTHLEPIFQTMTWHGEVERAPHFDPRYKGQVKSYTQGDYPNVESFWKRLSCFKTGMQTLSEVEKQVEALEAAIRAYQ
jgi:perosamine synthetase